MTKEQRFLISALRGQKIIAAPTACSDPITFMNGADEQFENCIWACASGLRLSNLDSRAFYDACMAK